MIMAGSVVLAEYDAGDIMMRNMVLVTLRRLGFGGQAVAAVLGLAEDYVATLYSGRSGRGRRRWPGRSAGPAGTR